MRVRNDGLSRVAGQCLRGGRVGAQSSFLLQAGGEGQAGLERLWVQVEYRQIRPTRLVRSGRVARRRRVRGCVHGEFGVTNLGVRTVPGRQVR